MNRTRLLSLLLGIVLTIPIAACAAGTAQASPNQISIMQDDDLLVNGSAKKADHALRVMAGMGVEYVRVTVLWSNVARGIKSSAHFNGKDPAAYPHANWDRYDNLVTNAGNDGIGVYLDVTGPGPAFSHTKAPNPVQEVQRRVDAERDPVLPVRRGGRQAVLGVLPQGDRVPPAPAAGQLLVAVERAEPGGMACAAVDHEPGHRQP